jgi:hypothetical protein
MSRRLKVRKAQKRKAARPRIADSVGGIPPDTVTNVGTNIVPTNFRTTMPYGYTWLNATAIPGFYDWVIRGNSCYDPDFAIGGDTCYGFDQMMAVWTHYKVLGSKIKVTCVNLDGTNPVNLVIIPTISSASYAAAQQDGLLNHPRAISCTVDRYDGSKVLSNSATTARVNGVKDLDDVGWSGDSTHNPTHEWFWHVIAFNNGGAAANCELKIQVLYDTLFTNAYPYNV